VQSAIERRVGEIADPVVRDYYRNEMRSRLARLRQPEAERGRPGARSGWRPRGPRTFGQAIREEVPLAAGAEARRAAVNLDSSRQERALLGALIEWPALLHAVAEELAALPIVHAELARLRGALLDALTLAPASAQEGAEDMEVQLIAEHLQRNGLARVAEMARGKARELFRDPPKAQKQPPLGQQVGQQTTSGEDRLERWRRIAQHLRQHQAGPEELRQAEQALAEDLSPENLQRLEAVLERLRRENLENGPR
jgi:DNA primase